MFRALVYTLLAISFLPANVHARSRGARAAEAKRTSTRADLAFVEAKKACNSLKNDRKRRQFRDAWIEVAQKFENVAEKYPRHPRAAQALFDAAGLYAELSRVSLAKRDLRRAIEGYRHLVESYPRSYLTDDAHWALGVIYRDRKGDAAKAQAEFRAALACKGDLQSKARTALLELGVNNAESKTQPAKPTASVVASASREEDDDDDDQSAPPSVAAAPAAAPKLDFGRMKALKEAAKSEVPLSVQVGLKVRRVIIDAGHGGYDTGAIGPTGLREKDVTLAIAKKLRARLEGQGLEAVLTRDSDRFVALEERARIANRHQGDLFVSVHCNAHKDRRLRGVETYTLNVTSDRYAIRLAARENAASERALSDLQFILADLATKANTDESVRLARSVQSQLVDAQSQEKNRARNLGVKQALFYVLLGARMPSVLVETAFLSNPTDEKYLRDAKKQDAMAEAIADGIKRFVGDRNMLARALVD